MHLAGALAFLGGWLAGNAAYDAVIPQTIQKRIASILFHETSENAEYTPSPYVDVVQMGRG